MFCRLRVSLLLYVLLYMFIYMQWTHMCIDRPQHQPVVVDRGQQRKNVMLP